MCTTWKKLSIKMCASICSWLSVHKIVNFYIILSQNQNIIWKCRFPKGMHHIIPSFSMYSKCIDCVWMSIHSQNCTWDNSFVINCMHGCCLLSSVCTVIICERKKNVQFEVNMCEYLVSYVVHYFNVNSLFSWQYFQWFHIDDQVFTESRMNSFEAELIVHQWSF